MSQTFIVSAERGSGPWWVLECAEVEAVSQVRRLDQPVDELGGAIAWRAGTEPQEVAARVDPGRRCGERVEAARVACAPLTRHAPGPR